jgi:hypothetical protein
MRCIYSYMPETSHVFSVRVAGIRVMPFPMINVLRSYISISQICAQCRLWLFSIVPYCRNGQVCWLPVFRLILRWLQLPLLYQFCLYISSALYFCRRVSLYIKIFLIFSLSHFCHLNLQCLLTVMFIFSLSEIMILSLFTFSFHSMVTLRP